MSGARRLSSLSAFSLSLFLAASTASAVGSPHAANDPAGKPGLDKAPGTVR